MKYVKQNGLAGQSFGSFNGIEAHFAEWMDRADHRIHGTTHERPIERFEHRERAALRPLPRAPLVVRHRRLQRRVSNDSFVDVDTVRYSVPFRFVRAQLDVLVGDDVVEVFHGTERVAHHARSSEPHTRVRDATHFAGIFPR